MNWVFISIMGLTVLQTITCGFSFPLLVSILGRFVFLLRLVGAVVPVKVSLGFEAARFFFTCLAIIFSKNGVDWVNVVLSILFTAVVCGLYIIDERFYLYVVDDDVEDD